MSIIDQLKEKVGELSEVESKIEAKLPQYEIAREKISRADQLKSVQSKLNYKLVDAEKLPVPISDFGKEAMIIELLNLRKWLKGQIENRIGIISNLKVWQAMSKLSDKADILGSMLSKVKLDFGKIVQPFEYLNKLATPLNQDEMKDAEFEEFKTLSAYNNPFAVFDSPPISGLWMDDKVFASQRLAGLNPMAIQRVSSDAGEVKEGVELSVLQKKLSRRIDQDAIRYFGLDLSLEQVAQQRRLYVCDYEALGEIKLDGNTTGFKLTKLYAPIVLFIKTDNFLGLQLLAIQLGQTAEADVMLAKDKNNPGLANNWLMAKMIVQASDVCYNQAVNHLLETHLIEDAIAVATRRQLAQKHPLNILLSRHFTALIAINKAGEKLLLSEIGLIQQILETGLDGALQLMKNRYETWTFDDLDFDARIDKRGMGDTEALTYFPYRDDGKLVWQVLGDYAEAYIKNYYKSDLEVCEDYELQSWAAELASRVKGFKPAISAINQLVTIVHRILWTAGPQHAAVNFPQIDYLAFVPNMPTAFYSQPPSDFSTQFVTHEELLEFLPPSIKTAGQMEVAYALSNYHYDSLLDYHDDLEPGASEICKKYFDRLQGDVTDEINRRNRQRRSQHGLLAYPYLIPRNIPNSTSV